MANAPLEVFSERINSMEISSTSAMVNTAAQLKRQGVDIVDLAPGEPHFPTPLHIKDAGIHAIQNNFTKYTAVAGLADLREAICDRHRQDFGSDYRWEEVIASPGGKYALFAALQVLVSAGDEVVIPVPYWVSFKDMVRFAGGKCVFLDTAPSDFVLTAGMVENVLTPKTRAIILNYPNNPSGALLDELATAPGIRIVLPGGGFFVFPEISEQLLRRNMKTAREFTTTLLEKTGVLTVSGEGFGLSNYMRISFSVSELQLSRGLNKLREFLAT